MGEAITVFLLDIDFDLTQVGLLGDDRRLVAATFRTSEGFLGWLKRLTHEST
jgi:hypothetical protein